MTQDEAAAESTPTAASEGSSAGTRARRPLPIWQESILLLVLALVLAVVLKAFFVQAFYIPSASMEPGLVKNDRILVEKWSYWGGGQPQRGDVVVFKDPGGWLGPEEAATPATGVQKVLEKVGLFPSGGHLVKRVIGVAGDVITCCDSQGRIEVNGIPLNEPYLEDGATCHGPMPSRCAHSWKAGPVPAGELFVMGDHRDDSADSSYHLANGGRVYVPVSDVVGKVGALVWPLGRFHVLHRPSTYDRSFASSQARSGS